MKIYDRSLTGAAAGEAGRAQQAERAGAGGLPGAAAHAGGDRVEFSGNLSALRRAVSTDQASREQRIRALTAEVQNGTYSPSPAAISRGMIADALRS